jgi:hypothetical protein
MPSLLLLEEHEALGSAHNSKFSANSRIKCALHHLVSEQASFFMLVKNNLVWIDFCMQ